MRLFDFFKKKKPTSNQTHRQAAAPVDNNSYLLETLRNKFIQLGYRVIWHPEYLALIVNAEMEIATVIIDNPNNHPDLIHIMILTMHPKYFPKGIEENIAGIGTTMHDKANAVIDNYINTTFLPIIDGFSDSHNADLDFSTMVNGKEVLWHPKLGNLAFQGQWEEQPQNEPFFEIVKDKLQNKLIANKFNWLKLYISKQADETIIGECLFNNEPWEEGLADITVYAESWEMKGSFQGLKQFIVFRKCDAFDD